LLVQPSLAVRTGQRQQDLSFPPPEGRSHIRQNHAIAPALAVTPLRLYRRGGTEFRFAQSRTHASNCSTHTGGSSSMGHIPCYSPASVKPCRAAHWGRKRGARPIVTPSSHCRVLPALRWQTRLSAMAGKPTHRGTMVRARATANDRLKGRWGSLVWVATVLGAGVHGAALLSGPEMRVEFQAPPTGPSSGELLQLIRIG